MSDNITSDEVDRLIRTRDEYWGEIIDIIKSTHSLHVETLKMQLEVHQRAMRGIAKALTLAWHEPQTGLQGIANAVSAVEEFEKGIN